MLPVSYRYRSRSHRKLLTLSDVLESHEISAAKWANPSKERRLTSGTRWAKGAWEISLLSLLGLSLVVVASYISSCSASLAQCCTASAANRIHSGDPAVPKRRVSG